MLSKFFEYKLRALDLRKKGFTYGEIRQLLNVKIPKSTLSTWFNSLRLSLKAQKRLTNTISSKLKKANSAALTANKKKREAHLKNILNKNSYLQKYIEKETSTNIAKIILAVLYLGEGAKGKRNRFMLGNSDPKIIKLFLDLLRKCYSIDESKFRCTLQCRADQDIIKLEIFWSNITKIPLTNFYKARIDPRTIGKKSKKLDYKGVCRIDYLSVDIFNEIKAVMEIICNLGI